VEKIMALIRFVLAQLNFTVGDIEKNAKKILGYSQEAKEKYQADIIIFPELALSGYPPEDLLLRKIFLSHIQQALDTIKNNLPEDLCAIIGYPEGDKTNVYNSAAVLIHGKIIANHRKQLLPNYGVFDEERYFEHGSSPCVFSYKDHNIGLVICEDLWSKGLAEETLKAGAQILISINASPFHAGKIESRFEKMRRRNLETELPLLYVNHCCAQDDLIFDGSSFALDETGHIVAMAPFAEECLLPLIWNDSLHGNIISLTDQDTQIYKALVLGVRDYVRKNHFEKVLLGFSGGIDSSLTLAISVDALGKENVLPVIMPSRYTSQLSLDAAHKQLKKMNLEYRVISIEKPFDAFLSTLNIQKENLTTENIQARVRAVILMAIANETNSLLLNTSNKSELSVGYGTLYGDMCGAYSVIKDLWKTEVYHLAKYRNKISAIIPKEIIERPPTAELSSHQLDTDTLPPYEILDEILKKYIEEEKSLEDIIKIGFDAVIVKNIIQMVCRSEYKRKQAPLGPRVSKLAFTRERRYPITSGFLI
jgi:NAD+ synthase (glutamine-hydrolysing)